MAMGPVASPAARQAIGRLRGRVSKAIRGGCRDLAAAMQERIDVQKVLFAQLHGPEIAAEYLEHGETPWLSLEEAADRMPRCVKVLALEGMSMALAELRSGQKEPPPPEGFRGLWAMFVEGCDQSGGEI